MQARPDVGPLIIHIVVTIVSKVHDVAIVAAKIGVVLNYTNTFLSCGR